ncbi:MAG: sortase [Chloroflexota bacterium]|nr:sortase [Chloroflexota bacterium]
MIQRIRQGLLPLLASMVVLIGLTAGVAANSGAGLPAWGGIGSQGPKAGPLGINTTTATVEGQVPVAINIPEAEVDAEVEVQQIVDGQMLNPSGPWVVSWYEQTSVVGERGNSIMSGHVDYWDVGPAVFWNLAKLQEGAEIRVVGQDGTTYIYALEYIERVYVDDLTPEYLNSPRLVGNTDYAALTLITCGGEFNYETGEYLSRDIIRARLVGTDTGNAQAAADVETPDTNSEEPVAGRNQATINDNGVNLRSEASTAGEVVMTLSQGDVVTVLGDSQEADGFVWWPVRLDDGTEGWVVDDYIDLAQ